MSDTIDEQDATDLTALTADIVSASIDNNYVKAGELAGLIRDTHAALSSLGASAAELAPEKPQGAVTVRKSLASRDVIVSMIDGKPYKTLRRHLATNGYTPESYRAAFGLPRDYPMVAPAYAVMRGDLAHSIGLGCKAKAEAAPQPAAAAPAQPKPPPAPKRRRKLGLGGNAGPTKARARGKAQPADGAPQA